MSRLKHFYAIIIISVFVSIICSCAQKGPRLKSNAITYYGTVVSRDLDLKDQSSAGQEIKSFYAENQRVVALVKFKNISGRHRVQWRWYDPAANLYLESENYSLGSSPGKYVRDTTAYHYITISGEEAQHISGKWRVDIYVDDEPKDTKEFWINPGPDPRILSLAPGEQHSSYFGLIIGIEEYENLNPADFAVADARQMKEYFIKKLGIPEHNIISLGDAKKATKSTLTGLLKKTLPLTVDEGFTLFVYFSGHGYFDIHTKERYLIPSDGDIGIIEQTGYNLKEFYNDLEKLNVSEIYVVLDTCFSGTARGGESLVKGERPMYQEGEIGSYSNYKKLTILSATSPTQTANSYEGTSHGLFTYFIMAGLKGEADTNQDGDITVEELFDYTSFHVRKTANMNSKNQIPTLYSPSGDVHRNKVLTSLKDTIVPVEK